MFPIFILLGTPRNHLSMTEIINMARSDVTHYKNAGVVRIVTVNNPLICIQ